jgi:hypothetical protein
MEKMDNNKEIKKPTAAAIAKQEEKKRETLAFNLDNYTIATDLCLAILQVEGTSEQVRDRANTVLLETLDKLLAL